MVITAPPETVFVDTPNVKCDGPTHDHPRVFLTVGHDGFVECPYCDRRFELKPGAKASGGH